MNEHNRTNRIVNYVGGAVVFIFFCSALLMAEDIMYWDNFSGPIAIPNISSKNQVQENHLSVILHTSGDAEITAENGTVAQLHSDGYKDTLKTEYMLSFDGHGSDGKTGGADTGYITYNNFLTPTTPAVITHVLVPVPDDDVVVTLSVRASNYPVDVADAGLYEATQTLTVHWTGPP